MPLLCVLASLVLISLVIQVDHFSGARGLKQHQRNEYTTPFKRNNTAVANST